VLWGSALFFAILLFDIAGDQIGWYAALRVWLIMILMPVIFFLISPRVRSYISLNTPPWLQRLLVSCMDVTGVDIVIKWCYEKSASFRPKSTNMMDDDSSMSVDRSSMSSISSNVPTTSSYRSKTSFYTHFSSKFFKKSNSNNSTNTNTSTVSTVNPLNRDVDSSHLSINEL